MKKILTIFFLISFFQTKTYTQLLQETKEEEILLQEIEVKEGQTLSYIANYYLKDPKRWPEILKYNKLSTSDIYAPLPGMKLKVPTVLVKEKFRPAHLIYILNKVQYRKKNAIDWKDAYINLELYNDDSIVTYANSRANIKFYSGEILSLDENSFITIRPELKREEVKLFQGAVRATKAKVITEHAEITPKIETKLPKTDFKTKIRPQDKATLVEVYEGAVDVTAQGKTVYVPKGFGTEVKPLSIPSEPKPLPLPPEVAIKTENIKISNKQEFILSKQTPILTLQLQEPPKITPLDVQKETIGISQKEAKVIGRIINQYRLQIAKDEEFKKIVYEEIKEIKPQQTFNLDLNSIKLPDGKYFYKLSFIDELGFESMPKINSFIVDTTPPELKINISSEVITTTDEFFTIKGETEPNSILKINEKEVSLDSEGKFSTVVLLRPGLNTIEICAKDIYGNEIKIERKIERVKKEGNEVKENSQTTQEKGTKLGRIAAFLISSSVIILVLLFFIK